MTIRDNRESFMKRFLAALVVMLPLSAHADDAPASVKDIMDVATAIWSDNPTDDWYFDDAHLAKDFSKDFVAAYRHGEKFPAYDEEDGVGSPFDYDVIANGQDGCAFKDITYKVDPAIDGVTTVHAEFDNLSCMGDEFKDKKNKIIFKVVTENGKPLIDDILNRAEGDDEPTNSLKAYLLSLGSN